MLTEFFLFSRKTESENTKTISYTSGRVVKNANRVLPFFSRNTMVENTKTIPYSLGRVVKNASRVLPFFKKYYGGKHKNNIIYTRNGVKEC